MKNQKTETVTQQKQGTVMKQKNPLRIEQGKKLVNGRKKGELRDLDEQIKNKTI